MGKAIVLKKDQKINLTKDTDVLKVVRCVLSWQTPDDVFPKYDLDVSAFLLGSNGKMLDEDSLIFYNSPEITVKGVVVNGAVDGSVWKSADEREGGTEEMYIDVTKLSSAVHEVSLIVTIHKAKVRKQSFDKVKGASIEIYNDQTGEKLAEFVLSDIASGSTSVQVGSFYQSENEFVFQAVAASYQLELADFVEGYSE